MAFAPSSSNLEDETNSDEAPAKGYFEREVRYKGDDPLKVPDGFIIHPVDDCSGIDSCHDNNEVETACDIKTEDLEKATLHVTCHLSVTSISEDRPEICPISGDERENCVREGKGWVIYVDKFTEEDELNCECEECHGPGTQIPRKAWAELSIKTASSMVNNDEEAKHTKCQFFCELLEADISKVSTLTAQKVVRQFSDNKGNWCLILCVTHDMELADRLYKVYRNWHVQMKKAGYRRNPYGEWKTRKSVCHENDNDCDEDGNCSKILPNNSTREIEIHETIILCKKHRYHKKFIPTKNFNIEHLPSCYHDKLLVDYVRATSDVTCRLLVSRFSKDRPETWPDSDSPAANKSYSDNDSPIYNDSLIVRDSGAVSMITHISEAIPETCPNSDQSSATSAHQRENSGTCGTGGLCYVEMYTEEDNINCECDECLTPGNTAKKTWGEVYMNTACHVVYNTEEARYTKFQFFYDSNETDINNVLTLTGSKVVGGDTRGDWCQIMCVTHDVELLNKLNMVRRHWYVLSKKVNSKFNKHTLVPNHDLCIIVSHPHCSPKQVSIGNWTHRDVVDRNAYKSEMCTYRYNTPTCPGSSGAQVMTMYNNRDGIYWFTRPPLHSEGRPGNDNNSGFCEEWVAD